MEHEERLLHYQKRKIALRYYLLGKGMHMAVRAMNFAKPYHQNFRKDGVSIVYDAHQIGMASVLRPFLPLLAYPEETMCVIFYHDLCEDYSKDAPEGLPLITPELLANTTNQRVADATMRLTKEYQGFKRNEEQLFLEMSRCPIASIAKPIDRSNNQMSMVGVFKRAKQIEYMEESETKILPMIKRARDNFPEQEPIYTALQTTLENEISLIRAIHAAEGQ